MKHLTVRFAWHDNKWCGKICRNPSQNFYCRSNYSLLSPRIQRRIKVDFEDNHKNSGISHVVGEYLPPCYWVINAKGNEKCKIRDPHPFTDILQDIKPKWKEVPPLEDYLEPFSVFTWCFKLGFAEEGYERYPPPEELKKRTQKYLSELIPNRSIVFFYANYSNPVNGDDYRYLILGAGLVKNTSFPQSYSIPKDLLKEIRSKRGMRNFPEQSWQFKVRLIPESVFFLPYHEYLEWIERKDNVDSDEKWKRLKEITLSVDEPTLIPHFKYVSMHMSHDKAIYLLYLIKKVVEKVKRHNVISSDKIKEIEKKVERLLKTAWQNRTEFPGFRNLLCVILQGQVDESGVDEFIDWLLTKYELKDFLDKIEKIKEHDVPIKFKSIMKILRRQNEIIKFFSRFDFTKKQFENILDIISRKGFETIRKNPYLLLEYYHYDPCDSWNLDESDYGIALYQIDIALIPDPTYTDIEQLYDAFSPERIRALITEILRKSAIFEGNSCLDREEILKRINEYPLYYIRSPGLKMSTYTLSNYEKTSIFKEKFIVISKFRENKVLYQLRELRKIEETIEDFIRKCSKKEYSVKDEIIDEILKEEKEFFKEINKIDYVNFEERRKLYRNALCNGLFVLTGKAGSGKTTAVVNLIKKFRKDKKLPVFIFTPTGKANLVIRKRLGQLTEDPRIRLSTIHRFIYGGLFEYIETASRIDEIFKLNSLMDKILAGRWELFEEFKEIAKSWKFNPKVLIIDESSMVDEVLLAVLFSLINPDALEHLILVGDEKQLPPIGVGRPLVDIIYHLKRQGLEKKIVRLESNVRFAPSTQLGSLSGIFEGDEIPLPSEIDEIFNDHDKSLQTKFFMDSNELREHMNEILSEIGGVGNSVFERFASIFESGDGLSLDKVQIITPRRTGNYGSLSINSEVVMEGINDYIPKTKLICEENIYFEIREGKRKRKILGLANGSIGYIKREGYIHFDEFQELIKKYGWYNVKDLINEVKNDIYYPLGIDRRLDLAYAITIHKAQGSDFDYVILVISEINPFITKELIYTGLTRAKKKLFMLIHGDLKDDLPVIIQRIWRNSEVNSRTTLLFEFKREPFKPYVLVRKNDDIVELRSKIEYIIAKTLDDLDIEFEYEPEELKAEYILPDFKITIDDKTFYLEHLGNMENIAYRERWFKKLKIYKKLGLEDRLITTSEAKKGSNIQRNIKKLIEDIKHGRLKCTEGSYSNHHYEI